MARRKWGWVVVAALVVTTVGGPADADPGGGERGGHGAPAVVAPTMLPVGETYRVTLLTGDVVTVTGRGNECALVSVQPATASGSMSRQCRPDGHVTVLPAVAAPLIGSVLDPALFDVTTLVLNGYDDARSPDLPLIVRPAAGLQRSTTDALTARLSGQRALPSIAAVAGRVAKTGGRDLLATVTGARSASARGSGTKVWLDRRVHTAAAPKRTRHAEEARPAPLDANLRQVSAPQAWAAGFTGRGARVAVLDTGVDFTHPDLAGRVAGWADFSVPNGDGVDRYGHGTHVAATLAGSGVGSGGERRGVAPDATLFVGKVLGDSGDGGESQIIAGMEWAAARADVINLSLGGYDQSDGTDPLSLAVDALTAKTGALFVVAAGNIGPTDGFISTPAAAASALTVGAVDHTDTVADFSSRGPVLSTRAAKPEIVAPGVDIAAARAAGTRMGLPVDDRYTVSSGTSMAAPHVAGAAALLVGRHPDWSPAQVKAALVGAADAARPADAYTVGAGRLDAAAALDGVVAGQAVVNLGASASETELSWVNTGHGSVAARLEVAVTDHGGRAGAGARLSTNRLTLAPGATGTATLNLARSAPTGLYTALVTARGADGAVLARTPVTFEIRPPMYDLTLTATPTPDGVIAEVYAQVMNIDDTVLFEGFTIGPINGEPLTLRVPAGRYSIMGGGQRFDDDGLAVDYAIMVGDPDVRVGADTAYTFDLAAATRVGSTVDGVATAADSIMVTTFQNGAHGRGFGVQMLIWGETARDRNLFVQANDGAGVGRFRAVAHFGLRADDSFYDVVQSWGNGIPADPTHHVTAAEKARMGRVDQTFHRIGGPTAHRRYGIDPEVGWYVAESSTAEVPDSRVDYVTPGVLWIDEAFYADGYITLEAARTVRPGSRETKTWARQPLRSDWYDDTSLSVSACQPRPPIRTRGLIIVDLVTLTDQHQRFDCLGGWLPPGATRSMRLYRNGSLVGETPENYADFAVPPGAGDFRLAFDVEPGPTIGTPARVSTEWTFRSVGPTGTGTRPLPLLSVDYALPLDVANRPVAGRPATFEVRQALGVPAQRVTTFDVWTSTDEGRTWQPARVDRAGAGFRATLPTVPAGQTMSLRVSAAGSAGSRIDQTIIAAYRT